MLGNLVEIDVVEVLDVASLPVEQRVGCRGDHVFGRVDLADGRVVEVVPEVVGDRFGEGCVVTTTHASIMVGDRIAVIDKLALLFLLRAEHVVTHVQPFKREMHQSIKLFSSHTEAVS